MGYYDGYEDAFGYGGYNYTFQKGKAEVVKVHNSYYVSAMPITKMMSDYFKDLEEHKIKNIVCLLSSYEVDMYFFEDLYEAYAKAGLTVLPHPVTDGSVPSTLGNWYRLVRFVHDSPENTIVHCVGGNGRSGTLLACLLVYEGYDPDSAIFQVRAARPRAVETRAQVNFVHRFERYLKARKA